MTIDSWIWIPIVCLPVLIALAIIFRYLANGSMLAQSNAVRLAKAGDLAGASKVLTVALDQIPPATQCRGKTARQRFHLLMLLSDVTRKGTGDAEKELEILDECVTLVKEIPPPPPGPDHLVNMTYMLHMNRGNAAGRTGRHRLAEQSYTTALEAARDPEIRCKCLTYQGWAIIRQNDNAKLAQAKACFDQFDHICSTFSQFLESTGKTISPSLVSYVWRGRAVLSLYENELSAARRACEQSIRADRSSVGAHKLLEVLNRPDVTAADGIRFVLEDKEDDLPSERSSRPLSPLPEDI